MPETVYKVVLTAEAAALMTKISNRVTRERIAERIESVRLSPFAGKPLGAELAGYYSVRAGSQRYRILYQIKRDILIVTVVWVGTRKEGNREDVYAAFKRFLSRK